MSSFRSFFLAPRKKGRWTCGLLSKPEEANTFTTHISSQTAAVQALFFIPSFFNLSCSKWMALILENHLLHHVKVT